VCRLPTSAVLIATSQTEQFTITTSNNDQVGLVQLSNTQSSTSSSVLRIAAANPSVEAQVGISNVISAVVDISLVGPDGNQLALQGTATICLKINGSEANQKQCLAYIDTSVNPPVWKCQDTCLSQVSPSFWCGTTDHFTDFGMLLTGSSSSGIFNDGPCGNVTQDYIFGSWWKEGILALSVAAFVVGALVLFSLAVLYIKPVNNLFFAKKARRSRHSRRIPDSGLTPNRS